MIHSLKNMMKWMTLKDCQNVTKSDLTSTRFWLHPFDIHRIGHKRESKKSSAPFLLLNLFFGTIMQGTATLSCLKENYISVYGSKFPKKR